MSISNMSNREIRKLMQHTRDNPPLPLANGTPVEIDNIYVNKNKPTITGKIIGWSDVEGKVIYLVKLDYDFRGYCENGAYISVLCAHEESVRRI